MSTDRNIAAAERAAQRERNFQDYLAEQRTKWKVPLSEEQYALIRNSLGPIIRARAEAAQRAAGGDEAE